MVYFLRIAVRSAPSGRYLGTPFRRRGCERALTRSREWTAKPTDRRLKNVEAALTEFRLDQPRVVSPEERFVKTGL